MSLMEKAKQDAERLHEGVVYGGGLSMMIQVERTAHIIAAKTNAASEADRETVITAAWLHKSQEKKRIREGEEALSDSYIEKEYGKDVLGVLKELAAFDRWTEEQEGDKTLSKTDLWKRLTQKAQTLSHPVREILLAEKVCNFDTSLEKPNPKWPAQKHLSYFETRRIMVDGLAETNPQIAKQALYMAEVGMKKYSAILLRQKTQGMGR